LYQNTRYNINTRYNDIGRPKSLLPNNIGVAQKNNNTLYLFWWVKTSEIPYARLLGGLKKNAKKQPNPIPGLIHMSTPHISSHSRTLSLKKQHAAATLLCAHGHPPAPAHPSFSHAAHPWYSSPVPRCRA
jgi:hypothetical protein